MRSRLVKTAGGTRIVGKASVKKVRFCKSTCNSGREQKVIVAGSSRGGLLDNSRWRAIAQSKAEVVSFLHSGDDKVDELRRLYITCSYDSSPHLSVKLSLS